MSNNIHHGFGIIEIIVYCALSSIIITSAITYALEAQAMLNRIEARTYADEEASMILQKARNILEFGSIDFPQPGSSSHTLRVTGPGKTDHTLLLSNGQLWIQEPSSSLSPIKPLSYIAIDDFEVTRTNDGKTISIKLIIEETDYGFTRIIQK